MHCCMKTHPRWPLALPCAVVGVSAVFGGSALVIEPGGQLLRMPLGYLTGTPFTTYLVPGLLLALVVGAGHLFAMLLVVRRSPYADLVALAAGGVLLTWITWQMMLLGTANALQCTMLAIALVILGESTRRLTVVPFEHAADRHGRCRGA